MFKKEEIKTRRLWLIVTLLLTFFPVVFGFLAFGARENKELFDYLIERIFPSLLIFIPLYFTYRKIGTAFLLFCLILSPFLFLRFVVDKLFVIAYMNYSPGVNLKQEISASLGASLLLYIYWFALTLKMRKINTAFMRRKLEGTAEYQSAVALFREAKDVDDLNQKFHQLVKEGALSSLALRVFREDYLKQKLALEMIAPLKELDP